MLYEAEASSDVNVALDAEVAIDIGSSKRYSSDVEDANVAETSSNAKSFLLAMLK